MASLEAGADVVLVSYSKPAETASAIEALGRKAYIIEADLSKARKKNCQLFEKALAFQGRIDILVNNAGIIRRTRQRITHIRIGMMLSR